MTPRADCEMVALVGLTVRTPSLARARASISGKRSGERCALGMVGVEEAGVEAEGCAPVSLGRSPPPAWHWGSETTKSSGRRNRMIVLGMTQPRALLQLEEADFERAEPLDLESLEVGAELRHFALLPAKAYRVSTHGVFE